MNKKVSVTPRWYGPVPTRNGNPLPKNQWARNGRKRKWTVRWYSPDGKRPRQIFGTKDDAEGFARERTAEFESYGVQARIRPESKTLGEFVDEVLALRIGPRGQRLSIGTLREYRTILNRFAPFVGRNVPLDQITIVDATRYLASLREKKSDDAKTLSTCSVNKHKRVLKSTFNVGVEQLRYIHRNPFEALKQDKVADQPIRYVDPAEYAAIIRACRAMHDPLWWECFLAACYTAGTRLNEATHLAWSDVDFELNNIRIAAKPELDGLASERLRLSEYPRSGAYN